MRRKKMITNEELVKTIMTTSQAGVLKQAFVIEALHTYSKMVLEDTEVWGARSLISQDAWKQCAKECIETINGRL
jgi:hypothetical protein